MEKREVREIRRLKAIRTALEGRKREHWLTDRYRECLLGGWEREDGSEAPPHESAQLFHRACQDPEHQVIFVGGGNQSSKSFTGSSEFVAWALGERPWDGTKTVTPGGRRFLVAAPSFKTHFPLVISPYLEERLPPSAIKTVVKDQNKNVVLYHLMNGNTIHCLSYEQFLKKARNHPSPFEGAVWDGAWFDEPPPRQVWIATKRGLVRRRSAGWGKVIVTATPLECPWLFNEVYQKAWNKGGESRSIFALEFSIYDNPALAESAIAEFVEGLSLEEQEARVHGRFMHLTGRIYNDFDHGVHVFDDSEWLPPGDWPVISIIDPHDRRPWAMGWAAISPADDLYFFREWPTGAFERMKRSSKGFDDYQQLLEEFEAELPGGRQSVVWREMDPNFGRSAKAGTMGRSIQEEMRNRGFYYGTRVDDNLTLRHSTVRSLLRFDKSAEVSEINRPKLFVARSCRNIIFGFENYVYDEYHDKERDPKERPKDQNKDFMDVVGYAAVRHPRFMSWKERASAWDTQRARLISSMQNSSLGR